MKPDVKARWVAALRSGEYAQGSSYLHISYSPCGDACCSNHGGRDEYCCLGVLCALAVADGADVRVEQDENNVAYSDETSYLPLSVQRWAGLSSNNPTISWRDDDSVTLSMLNDEEHLSFPEIAQLIEEQL